MYYSIHRGTVHDHAAGILRSCLRLKDFSPRCTAGTLLHVLFAACARLCSLSAACWSLAKAPSRETVRKALHTNLPPRDELLRRLNRALVADVPRALRRRPPQVAADLTLVPYYGEPLHDEGEIYRGQAKAGSRRLCTCSELTPAQPVIPVSRASTRSPAQLAAITR